MRFNKTTNATLLACCAALAFAACSSSKMATSNANAAATPLIASPPQAPTPLPDTAARISIADARAQVEKDEAVFVDVRGDDAYKANHIKGALSFPLDKIVDRRDELPKGKKIITYCS